jgi:hypothetical protein
MVRDYEMFGRKEEAWALVQETCDAFRRERRLDDRWVQPWLTRVVEDHEKCGREEEACALVQEIFDVFRRKQDLITLEVRSSPLGVNSEW